MISIRTQDFRTLAKTMIQQRNSNLHSNLAVRHGIINEEICRRRYVTEQGRSKIVCFKTFVYDYLIDNISSTTYPCGLVVDPTAPYLCCSPDAIVMEKSNNKTSFGILECKCVYSEPGATWNDLILTRENFCLERHGGRLRLRPGHPYYYQLITLLSIVDLQWIDICIMKNEDIYIERFIKDDNTWPTIKEKLTTFYFNFLLSEIIKND